MALALLLLALLLLAGVVAGLAADACDDGGLSDIRQIFQTGRRQLVPRITQAGHAVICPSKPLD